MKKLLNPFIFMINLFRYFAYLEDPSHKYDSNIRYDFSKDIKYF